MHSQLANVGRCRASGSGDPGWSAAISFSILANGRAVGIKVSQVDERTADCLERLLRGLQARVGDNVTVEGTWVFGRRVADRNIARSAGILGTLGPACPEGVCVKIEGVADSSRRLRIKRSVEGVAGRLHGCFGKEISFAVTARVGRRGKLEGVAPVGRAKAARCGASVLRGLRIPKVAATSKVRIELSAQVVEYGGLTGARVGTGGGGWGYGMPKKGGGGTGWGTIGVGKYGKSGYGSGRGSGRRSRADVRIGPIRAVGGPPKEVSRRYLRRSLARFRYCYEKERQRRPGLRGVVKVALTLSGDGGVSKVAVTGGTNRQVRACLHRQVRRIKFPATSDQKQPRIRFELTFRPSTNEPAEGK